MLNTGGKFDLLKLQMLIFTLLTGIYVLSRIADTAAFPDLDTQTLLLMGVSHGIYLGGKIGSTSEFSDAKVSLAEAVEADQAVQAKSAELADLKSKQDALNAELATMNTQLDTANKIVAPAPSDTTYIASLKISIAEKQKSLKDLDAAVAVKKDEFIKLTKDSVDKRSALAKRIADLGLTQKDATPEPKKN